MSNGFLNHCSRSGVVVVPRGEGEGEGEGAGHGLAEVERERRKRELGHVNVPRHAMANSDVSALWSVGQRENLIEAFAHAAGENLRVGDRAGVGVDAHVTGPAVGHERDIRG